MIVFVVGFGTLLLFMTQRFEDTINRQFPDVDCDVLTRSYFGEKMLEHYALLEYHNMEVIGITRETLLQLSTSNLQ